MVKLTVSNTHFLYYVQPYVRRAVHSIKCVLLMVRLTLYMGIVHLSGAFEVSTTRIQVCLYWSCAVKT